jgi:hypothetical protein
MEGLDLSILEPQAAKRHRQEALADGTLQAQGVDLGQLAFPLPAVTDVSMRSDLMLTSVSGAKESLLSCSQIDLA